MKEIYETPEMEIVEFDTEDVITTSGGQIDEGGAEGWQQVNKTQQAVSAVCCLFKEKL